MLSSFYFQWELSDDSALCCHVQIDPFIESAEKGVQREGS